jgi:hypothetical protein
MDGLLRREQVRQDKSIKKWLGTADGDHPMKKHLILLLWVCASALAPMSVHAESLAREDARSCKAQPLTLTCLERYSQRNQDNVDKVLGDITAGRPPVLRAPALPLLEDLPSLDLRMLELK